MVSKGTLYTYPDNFRAYKALIAANFSGAQITVDKSFVFGKTNKTKEFLKKFPLGKVPAFETSDGEYITESNAIAMAVSNEQLVGKTPMDRAKIVQWMNFADNEVLPASCTWIFPTLGIMPYNKNATEHAKEDIKKALGVIDEYMIHRTYLVGERITLADICLGCTLLHLYKYVLEPAFRKPYMHTYRWFNTLVHQPEFKNVIGDFFYCEKMAQFDNKKFAEVQSKLKAAEPKKEKPAKEQKEKSKSPAPKSEPKAAAPAAEAPKKPKDPMDALPAGSLDMDDWKRFYSNNDEDKSVPYFWEKFDKENYSIWFCEYKYPDELTKVFMSCNLIGGMFQRLDKFRKYSFASMAVFGEDNANNISGVWVWRGQELAFPLCEDWTVDYESYDWKKLDPESPDTKNLVDQYWKWIGNDNKGRKFNQGKIFK